MLSFRSFFVVPATLLAALCTHAQEAAPSTPKSPAVPIFDTPPSLTLPLPKKPKPQEKAAEKPSEKGSKPAPKETKGTKEPSKETPAPEKLPEPSGPLRPVQSMNNLPPSGGVNSSTTELGQFVIHGADLPSRTYITKICEETAEELSDLLHDTEHFEIPIVVSIKTPPNVSLNGPAVSTDIAELSFGGFRLQVTLQVRPDFNVNDFRAELTRMLIAERILRGTAKITTKRTRILPDWLLVGIKEAQRYRSRSRPSAVFAAIFRTGKVYSIEEILEATPGSLDSLSRSIYETSCCALVLALLDQPDGNLRMAKFLRDLATDSKSDREMLTHWFPGLNASKSSLNKWWSLQMASLATPSIFETLGPSETAKELDQALELHYETTPDEAPATHVASADEAALNADAETESKKRGFFTRMFSSDKGEKGDKPAPPPDASLLPKTADTPAPAAAAKPEPTPAPTETKPAPKPKPEVTETKPAAKAKVKAKPEAAEVEESTDAPAKPGFSIRRMFGFGSSSAPAEETPAKDEKAKSEAKKEAKPAPEAKKDLPKAKDQPKEQLKAKDQPKEQPKAKDQPKEQPKAKDQPKAKPTAEPKADEAADKAKPSFLGRMFGGKKAATDEAKPEDSKDQPKAKAKPKKGDGDDKPSASAFDASLILRALADISVPGLSVALNASDWLGSEEPRFTAFPFFGKKAAAEPAPDAEKGKPTPAKQDKPKEEPKPKKPRLVTVSIPLSDYSRILKRPDAKAIFKVTTVNLAALGTRANPLFRPLIKEYIELVADLSNHKTKDVDARLKALREERDEALAQAKNVRDYLDWYEASESNDYSSAFDDYLRLPKTIDQEISPRADPISKLLDEVEQQADGK